MSALPNLPFKNSEHSQTILLVSPSEDDHFSLRRLLGRSHWGLEEASSTAQGLKSLAGRRLPVAICSDALPDGGWKRILREAQGLHSAPRIIVSSRLAEDALWAEVLNLGGYDVILTPFVGGELFRVLHLAWCSWNYESDSRRKASAVFHRAMLSKRQSAAS